MTLGIIFETKPSGRPALTSPVPGSERLPLTSWHTGRAALLIGGCIAYVISKNIASAGRVTIDELQFWLIGMMPFLLLRAYASIRSRNSFRSTVESAWRIYSLTWTGALIAFLVAHETRVSEWFRLAMYHHANVQSYAFANFLSSFAYVAIGIICVISFASFRPGARPAGRATLLSLIGLGLINWAMFYVLVFWLPAA